MNYLYILICLAVISNIGLTSNGFSINKIKNIRDNTTVNETNFKLSNNDIRFANITKLLLDYHSNYTSLKIPPKNGTLSIQNEGNNKITTSKYKDKRLKLQHEGKINAFLTPGRHVGLNFGNKENFVLGNDARHAREELSLNEKIKGYSPMGNMVYLSRIEGIKGKDYNNIPLPQISAIKPYKHQVTKYEVESKKDQEWFSKTKQMENYKISGNDRLVKDPKNVNIIVYDKRANFGNKTVSRLYLDLEARKDSTIEASEYGTRSVYKNRTKLEGTVRDKKLKQDYDKSDSQISTTLNTKLINKRYITSTPQGSGVTTKNNTLIIKRFNNCSRDGQNVPKCGKIRVINAGKKKNYTSFHKILGNHRTRFINSTTSLPTTDCLAMKKCTNPRKESTLIPGSNITYYQSYDNVNITKNNVTLVINKPIEMPKYPIGDDVKINLTDNPHHGNNIHFPDTDKNELYSKPKPNGKGNGKHTNNNKKTYKPVKTYLPKVVSQRPKNVPPPVTVAKSNPTVNTHGIVELLGDVKHKVNTTKNPTVSLVNNLPSTTTVVTGYNVIKYNYTFEQNHTRPVTCPNKGNGHDRDYDVSYNYTYKGNERHKETDEVDKNKSKNKKRDNEKYIKIIFNSDKGFDYGKLPMAITIYVDKPSQHQ